MEIRKAGRALSEREPGDESDPSEAERAVCRIAKRISSASLGIGVAGRDALRLARFRQKEASGRRVAPGQQRRREEI